MIFRNLTARIVLDLRGPSVETKKSFVSRLDDVFKERVIDHVKRNRPSEGLVQVLTITEKQYSGIVMVVGGQQGDVISTSERLVIL